MGRPVVGVQKQWFKKIRANTLAQEVKAATTREDISQHFELFKMALADYGIATPDIYNMDETGFRIGCVSGRIVITHIHTKAVYLADPDNR